MGILGETRRRKDRHLVEMIIREKNKAKNRVQSVTVFILMALDVMVIKEFALLVENWDMSVINARIQINLVLNHNNQIGTRGNLTMEEIMVNKLSSSMGPKIRGMIVAGEAKIRIRIRVRSRVIKDKCLL